MKRHTLRLCIVFILVLFAAQAWAKDYIYVTNNDAGIVTVIDADAGLVVKEARVGVEPCGIAIEPGGRYIAISHEARVGDVWILDRMSFEVKKKILLHEETGSKRTDCFFLAFSGNGRKLYAANRYSGLVYVIDPVAGSVKKTINLKKRAEYSLEGVVLSPDKSLLYLANGAIGEVFVIDTRDDTERAPIVINGVASAIAAGPEGKTLYVVDGQDPSLLILDTETKNVVKRIPVGAQPTGAAVSKDGMFVYVSNKLSYSVTKIDTALKEAVANIPVGTYPIGIKVSPDGKRVYVCNYNENSVSIIDASLNVEIARVSTGSTPVLLEVFSSP